MRIGKWVVAMTTCMALSSAALAADGWERGSAYNKIFDSKTIQTISGKVVSIDRNFRPLKGMEPGFMAVIKTDQGSDKQVQVGPAWFTSFYKQKWDVKVGDAVKVTGSAVKIEGKDVIMASQGEKGKLKMTIRGKAGAPLWDLQPTDF